MFTENTARSVYEQCFWVVGSGLLDIKQKTGLQNPQGEGALATPLTQLLEV